MAKNKKESTQEVFVFSKEHSEKMRQEHHALMEKCCTELLEVSKKQHICAHDIALNWCNLLAMSMARYDIGVHEVMGAIGYVVNDIFDTAKARDEDNKEGEDE